MRKFVALVIVGSLFLTGCASKSDSADSTATDVGAISVPSIAAAAFQAKIFSRGVIVLDVRTAAEFKENHLIDARNINVESKDFDVNIAELDKKTVYAIYCQTGRRSAIAYTKMKDAGFMNLYNLDGGMEAWVAAGLPRVGN